MWAPTQPRYTATVSSKGQFTIPKQLREEIGIAAGDEIRIVRGPGRRLTIVPRNGSLESLFGSIKSPHGRPLTIEELKEDAADGWAFGDPDESEWVTEEGDADARAA